MKFSVATLSALIAVLPVYVSALPSRSLSARQAAGSVGTTDITTNATANNPDLQSSLTLDPSVIATGFEQNGQAVQEAGQVPSLTSNNNFINFCLTTNQPLTNGQQVKTGSCNPAPMGQIPATTAMPSAKFSFPANFGNVDADTQFTVTMNIQNLETGNFVNAEANYFAAPQQLSSAGTIVGHSHIVIEAINGLNDTTPTDPTTFAFFLGLNAAATNGVLSANVASGLAAGTYRMASINTAANHQPVLVPVAQHGALDDVIYFTVGGGANANNVTAEADAADQGSTGNAVSAAVVAASSAAAAASGTAAGAAAAAAVSSASVAALEASIAATAGADAAAATGAADDAAAATGAAAADAAAATGAAAADAAAATGADAAVVTAAPATASPVAAAGAAAGGAGGNFAAHGGAHAAKGGKGGFGGFRQGGKKRFAREY